LIFNDSERDVAPEAPISFPVSNELKMRNSNYMRAKVVSEWLGFRSSHVIGGPEQLLSLEGHSFQNKHSS
jgi:hypothetical protein